MDKPNVIYSEIEFTIEIPRFEAGFRTPEDKSEYQNHNTRMQSPTTLFKKYTANPKTQYIKVVGAVFIASKTYLCWQNQTTIE